MNVILGQFKLGGGDIVLIFAIALLLLNAKRLPELATGLDRGIKEFQKAVRDLFDGFW
jgi:sec-independent protein translocase protein TatA